MSDCVVITGSAAATPIGRSSGQILGALRAGRSGVARHGFEGFPDSLWFGHVAPPGSAPDPDRPDRALGFAIEAARNAMAGSDLLAANIAPDRVAVIVSSSKGLLSNLLAARLAFLSGEKGIGTPFSGFAGDAPSRHIAATFGFTGPALNYPAACATGIASLVPAVHLLRDGVVDAVVAGSTEACGHPLVLAGFASMGALDAGLSRPFHRDRNGFNAGEGAAVMVLERESDALRRGARPLARLAGWDLRADAHSATAVEPDGRTLEYAIRRTLARANWNAEDVGYINAHGTGTRLNDAVESGVIARVFGSPESSARPPLVSGLKPSIGHLLGASASVELALVLLALRNGFVPPTLRLDCPDPALLLNHVPPTGAASRVERFLKLSLGFGGHIGVLALELYPGASESCSV